jgi:hypothetical protein
MIPIVKFEITKPFKEIIIETLEVHKGNNKITELRTI